MSAPLTPVRSVVPDARAMLQHIEQLIDEVKRSPSNVAMALAAFVLLYHVKDWVRPKDDGAFFDGCPFAQTLGEIANGAKHFEVSDRRFTADPHVGGVAIETGMSGVLGGAPLGATPIGGGTPDQLWVRTRRTSEAAEELFWPATILVEAFGWWSSRLLN